MGIRTRFVPSQQDIGPEMTYMQREVTCMADDVDIDISHQLFSGSSKRMQPSQEHRIVICCMEEGARHIDLAEKSHRVDSTWGG